MKTSSSSRGRSATQNSQPIKNVKPNAINKQNPPLQNVNLNIDGKKTLSRKPNLPKVPSKIQYNVEVNMTQSKIIQAKQGLQLLKRKMNRTGMSRQKNHSQFEKLDENLTPFSKTNINKTNNLLNTNLQKKPIIPKNQKSIPLTKNKEQVKNTRQKPIQRQINKFEDERPITCNNNFMALLQKQMKKEGSLPAYNPKKVQVKQANKILDENGVEIILHECSKGCGRMFNLQVINRHQKICQKVFQTKRKEFNSAVHRQVQAENYKPPTNLAKNDSKPMKAKNQIPKWKLESAAFRAGLKMGKNQELTKEQQKMMQIAQQGLIVCQFCGRKFNEAASKKHIPFCQKKSKQISKINIKKR